MEDYDVIIVGGGPSGSTAAMYLGQAGKRVLLVDKEEFPRDKTCGDAQGRKAARVMKELGIYDEYVKLPGQPIYGLTLSSPDGTHVHLDVESRDKPAPGYVRKRIVFDNFLYQHAKRLVETRTLAVNDILVENGKAKGIAGINKKGEKEEYTAKLILGADGATSVVARKFGLDGNPPEHHIVALRAYYRGVEGMTDRIEIHLIERLIPGYFWIFPLPNKEANVGLGMIIKDMRQKGINLKEAMLYEIENNPIFVERFEKAKLETEIRAWNLPIASYHRKSYGNGFMLLGDAASLIDPLSGEGVGNAMISAKIAAEIALEALEANDFSESFLKIYDKRLWDEIGDEIKANHRLQWLGKKFPHLINRLINKAAKNEEFRKKLEGLLPHAEGRKKMSKWSFLRTLIG